MFDRVQLIQIDSVNVLVRSQELPLFARLGPHRRDLLPVMAAAGELFEYWGHEASLIPVEQFPLLRFQMERAARGERHSGLASLEQRRPGYAAAVLEEVAARGPLTANELSDGGRRRGTWWDWSDGKVALESLFMTGQVSARRRATFEREYDLTERLIPPAIYQQPAVAEADARRELVARSARALGVATARDLFDYFRLKPVQATRPRLDELVEDGRLVPVQVEGWRETAYLDPGAATPRRVRARALLSPFDSLIWERARTDRLWAFHYRIEIYTPAPKRRFGYYVLPFLLGEHLVGRVDVKADRVAGVLRVPGAYAEPGVVPEEVAGPLAEELQLMASWLGLSDVEVGDRGDLAPALRSATATAATATTAAATTRSRAG